MNWQKIGNLIWREKPGKNLSAGVVAGGIQKDGYHYIRLDGHLWKAHRLVWLWHGRELPYQIDHINGIASDNRIENLRVANSQIEQQQNQKIHSNNTSGHVGVSWYKNYEKWETFIWSNNKRIRLGYFEKFEDACKAQEKAKVEYHSFQPISRE